MCLHKYFVCIFLVCVSSHIQSIKMMINGLKRRSVTACHQPFETIFRETGFACYFQKCNDYCIVNVQLIVISFPTLLPIFVFKGFCFNNFSITFVFGYLIVNFKSRLFLNSTEHNIHPWNILYHYTIFNILFHSFFTLCPKIQSVRITKISTAVLSYYPYFLM